MEGIVGLMFVAGYVAVQAWSFTVHALSYGAQGAVYIADETLRTVGAGPSVTTFEVELIAPAAAAAGEREAFVCVRSSGSERESVFEDAAGEGEAFACVRSASDAPSGERIHCLNRSYFTSVAGFAEPDGDPNVCRFQVAVDDAPESVCLYFYDQVQIVRGSWFITGSDSQKPHANSLSALPTVISQRPPLGTLCLSGVPSSGEVTVKGVSCAAGTPSTCQSAAVAMVPAE